MSIASMSDPLPEETLPNVDSREERFLKWIPIAVPLFALLVTVGVFLIGAEVL